MTMSEISAEITKKNKTFETNHNLLDGIVRCENGKLGITDELLQKIVVLDEVEAYYEVEAKELASSKFSVLHRIKKKDTGEQFVAKYISNRYIFLHELAVNLLLKSEESILQLKSVHLGKLYGTLIFDLATSGDIYTFLGDENKMTINDVRYTIRQVLKALKFLHQRSIVHLDLKPENILIMGFNVMDGVKLCDFGISRYVPADSNVRRRVGSLHYMAPEVLQCEPISVSSDIWSIGCIVYELVTDNIPFASDTFKSALDKMQSFKLTFEEPHFENVPLEAKDFIRRTLVINASERMTAEECLEHPWLKEDA